MPMTPGGFGMNSVFAFNSNPYNSFMNTGFNTGPQYPSLMYDLMSNNNSPSYNNNYYNSTQNSYFYSAQQSQSDFVNLLNPMNLMAGLFDVLTPKTSQVSRTSRKPNNTNYNTKTNLPQFKDINYDKEKGNLLAQKVVSGIPSYRGTPLCAKYTKLAIQNAGLGEYIQGHAYACADILRGNPNFKEIKVSGNQLSKLPAGCIIVYDKGAADYSKDYGHIEITLGDGRAASDFINNNIKVSDNIHVFAPV